jgi:uncharacterized membrane protein (UPF0127 family)
MNGRGVGVIGVRKCNWFTQIIGLMFSRRHKADALLFSFQKPTKMAIHSCFVFFPFFAVWLDNKNRIMERKKIKPFTLKVSPTEAYYSLLEVPINKKYEKVVDFLSKNKI